MDSSPAAVVVLPDGITKEIIQSASGRLPTRGSTVYLHYTGFIVSEKTSEEPFDSSSMRQPFSFPIGKEHTITGLETALCSMREGEHARIVIPPAQAFGAFGNPQGFHGRGRPIPGDATLIFDVRLLDVAPTSTEGTPLAEAMSLKSEGNQLFRVAEFERASLKYSRGIKVTDDLKDEAAKPLKLACLANLTACHLNLSNTKLAISTGKKVLELNPAHVKTVFRLSQAYLQQGMHKEAREHIVKAIKLDPKNRQLRDHYFCVKDAIAKARAKDKEVYSAVFTKLEEEDLYTVEDVRRAKIESRESKMKTCTICGDRVEEVQYARHVIKKHSSA